ncbi:MAG: peptide ABC transporter ATP-binding protein [Planctomycetes bacterium]|nr:peptide ABC transporter ATP-binding protein [Planctomycetota bacterium]
MLGLLPRSATVGGSAIFEGSDLLAHGGRFARTVRGGRVAMVFQDPQTSLNPYHSVGRQVYEAVRLHRAGSASAARTRVIELFREVGIPDPEGRVHAYPHQMSGGLRQRVLIAMALAGDPELVIADEPTTALDVTVQAQILALFRRLAETRGLSLLLITHDLGVVAELADEVAVVYAGRVVECAPAADLFADPRHPYARGLLKSIPSTQGDPLTSIPGHPPDPRNLPAGCPFRDRCEYAVDTCTKTEPDLIAHGGGRRALACPVTTPGTPA